MKTTVGTVKFTVIRGRMGGMSEKVFTLTESEFRLSLAYAWDRAVASMTYEDGSKVEVAANSNPYKDDK